MSNPPEGTNQPTALTDPQNDADRIRLKRLAKLQNAVSPSPSSTPLPSGSGSSTPPVASTSSTPAPVAAQPPAPKPIPKPSARRPVAEAEPPRPTPVRKPAAPAAFNLARWEPEAIGNVFNVTLDRDYAEARHWEVVWLKSLSEELKSESNDGSTIPPLSAELADRVLIARLELDPQEGLESEDPEIITVVANLPSGQTALEYLVSCWQRINASRVTLNKRATQGGSAEVIASLTKAQEILDQLRDLVISYAGLTLQDSTMFPQPQPPKELGVSEELLLPLLSIAAATGPLGTTHSRSLQAHEVEPFINDLVRRFGTDGPEEIAETFGERLIYDIIAIVVKDSAAGGLASTVLGVQSWRSAVSALEALTAIKPMAAMIPTLQTWLYPAATPNTVERLSLVGHIARLGIFGREWPTIPESYYSNPERRTRDDVEASNTTLRNTLHTVQQSLFNILNAIVRSSTASTTPPPNPSPGPAPREAVLNYFAKVIQLNTKRSGSHVDPTTVASDGFMINLLAALLHFSDPFLDAKFSKLDRVDTLYYARSDRLDIAEETRILADAPAAKAFRDANHAGPAPNFISDIFYLTNAFIHYGLVATINTHDNVYKRYDDLGRELERVQSDQSHQGTPQQAQVDQLIERIKDARAKSLTWVFAYQCQLLDNDLVFRTIAFTTFSMAWLIRVANPGSKYPTEPMTLPLPQTVPEAFKMLPEYFIEDIIEFYLFLVRNNQQPLEASAKNDLLVFIVTFLSSPRYIKNPFLKAKLVQIMFYGTLAYARSSNGVFTNVLNSHPLALQHLMPVLMNFYVDVENTGASSQFYDKFDARRNVAYILRVIWNNPVHRAALAKEADNTESFVRFTNLLMNDATYLLDESLSKITEIHNIQAEMANKAEWDAREQTERQEREAHLRQTEGQATSYITLGKSTIELLKLFTAEVKVPWMQPEIVGRLAAMLDYNLDMLTGPRSKDLHVEGKDKFRFNPRQLLSDILAVFINLSTETEFVRAVAQDERSYKKEIFEKAAGIAVNKNLKSPEEVEKLRLFVIKVEETKASIEVEDDVDDVPEEFMDPIAWVIMKDPVILPSSKAIVDRTTIKQQLLSVPQDPFNRSKLTIEEVIPAVELKARIDEFLAQSRGSKKSALNMPTEEVFKVDQTAGLEPDAMETD